MLLPTQTQAWLLQHKERDRKAVSFLAQTWPCTPHPQCIFMPAYMSSVYHTRAIHKDFPHQCRGICNLTWLVPEWFCLGAAKSNWPHHPSQLFSKGSCHSLDCEREGAQESEDERRSRWGSAGPWECKHRSPTSRSGIYRYTSFFPPAFGKWDWNEFVIQLTSKKDFEDSPHFLGSYLRLCSSQSSVSTHPPIRIAWLDYSSSEDVPFGGPTLSYGSCHKAVTQTFECWILHMRHWMGLSIKVIAGSLVVIASTQGGNIFTHVGLSVCLSGFSG